MMKFSIAANAYRSLMDNVLRVGINDATHPGYGLLHLEVTKKGALRATVVNSQAAVRMAMPTGDDNVEPGEVAMRLSQVATFSKNIPNDDERASFVVTRAAATVAPQMRIASGAVLQKGPMEDVANIAPFPTPPDSKGPGWREVSAEDHALVASRITLACAPHMDARTNLTGVHMTSDKTEASDGHRIATLHRGLVNGNVLVPPAALIAASAIAGNAPLKIMVTDNRIWFHGAFFMMTCRLIEGLFPDTSIFTMEPDQNGTIAATSATDRKPVAKATVKSQVIRNASTIISNSSDEAPEMQFLVRDDKLVMTMKGGKDGLNAAVSAPWQPHGEISKNLIEELTKLTLDARYVGSAIDTLRSDDVTFTWAGQYVRAGLSAGDVSCIIMPKGNPGR